MYGDNNGNGYQSYYNNGGNSQQGYQNYYQQSPPPRPPKKPGLHWLWTTLIIVVCVAIVAVSSVSIFSMINAGTRSTQQYEATESENAGGAQTDGAQTDGAPETAPAQQPESPADEPAPDVTSDSLKLSLAAIAGSDMTPEAVANAVIPSVVCIQNYRTVQSGGYGYPVSQRGDARQEATPTLYGEGSGIIISADGYIVTNAHVVENAELIKVVASDDAIYEAALVGIDEDTDIAVVKIAVDGLAHATFSSAANLSVGEYVMAVGNPGGLEFSSSVTLGIVSAINRPLDIDGGYTMNTVQTDAAINPGNSGGALVNMSGQVVGICSAKYVASGFEGLGFAITIDDAQPIIEDLIANGRVTNRSMLGVSGQLIDSMTSAYYDLAPGYYIAEVNNPNAGTLRAGDVITAINGSEVSSASDIKNAIHGKAAGTAVTLTYYRGGESYTTDLTLIAAR